MPKRVDYSHDAAKALQRMDRATAKRVRDKIRQLATDPESLANNLKALKGAKGLMRLRVGDWRVIFTEGLLILHVVKIRPRSSAYD